MQIFRANVCVHLQVRMFLPGENPNGGNYNTVTALMELQRMKEGSKEVVHASQQFCLEYKHTHKTAADTCHRADVLVHYGAGIQSNRVPCLLRDGPRRRQFVVLPNTTDRGVTGNAVITHLRF